MISSLEFSKKFEKISKDISNIVSKSKSFIKSFIEGSKKDGVFLIACGRTLHAISLLLKELTVNYGIKIKTPSDTFLEDWDIKSYVSKKKPTILIASGSGETSYVLGVLKSIEKLSHVKYFAITGNKKSTLVRMLSNKGKILYVDNFNFGLLRDSFEISLIFLPKYRLEKHEIEKFALNALKSCYNIITKSTVSKLIEKFCERRKVIVSGVGVSDCIANSFAIRLNHLLSPIGNSVMTSGEFAGEIRRNDIVIFITYSGLKNDLIKRWYQQARKLNADIYFVSRKKINKQTIIIDEKERIDFYIKAYLLCTLIAIKLSEELKRKGYSVNPSKYHSPFK